MGRLIYSLSVSLDGYVETPGRSLDWVQVDEELHAFFNDQSRGRASPALRGGCMTEPGFEPALPRRVPYGRPRIAEPEMLARAGEFRADLGARRSIRDFAPDPVPRALIEEAVMTAATAPSGAHQQPWTFVAVGDPAIRRQIRLAAEEEERRNYEGGRMPAEWLAALAPLGTDWHKPFLETAPWIVVLFEQVHGWFEDGSRKKHYYARESVGIACGLFIAAIHRMGLATLTHTPSPMGFLSTILGRPKNERPFVLLPVGYPAAECTVPDLRRKPLDEVAVFIEG